jgi:hypothetical protein
VFSKYLTLMFGSILTVVAADSYSASAFAVDHDKHVFGIGNNLPTETAARQRAMENCSKHSNNCKIIASTGLPGHGAFFASLNGWGVAVGKASLEEAQEAAISQCKAKLVDNCKSVRNWLDNTATAAPAAVGLAAPSATKRDTREQDIQATSKIPAALIPHLRAYVKTVMNDRNCTDGCKDFEVACSWTDPIGRADRANGIAEQHWVGLQFLQLAGGSVRSMFTVNDGKWHEQSHAIQFTLLNGSWKSSPAQFGWEIVESRCRKPK